MAEVAGNRVHTRKIMKKTIWHSKLEDYQPQEKIRLAKGAALLSAALAHCPAPVEVLDIGCGSGPMHEFLPADRFRITGLEMEPESAASARRNYARVVCQDLLKPWPFDNASFDGVIAAAILEHVVDYDPLLDEAARVIKPGGCFIVEVPNLGYWKEVRKLLLRHQPHWLKQRDHVHGWTLNYLQDILRAHGFDPVMAECDRLNLPLIPSRPWLERRLASWGRVLVLQLVKKSGDR
jgi:SAM-dependent methyltransferase